MPYCCVPGCENKGLELRNANITFHRLPINNSDVLKIWIEKLNLKPDSNILDHHRVCSQHFEANCFRESTWPNKRLVPGAIPNRFCMMENNKAEDKSECKNHFSAMHDCANSEHCLTDFNAKNTDFSTKKDKMDDCCVIPNCENYHGYTKAHSSTSLHSFPVDGELLAKWSEAVNRNRTNPLKINQNSYICGLHFRPDDYINRNSEAVAHELNANAVPSIFYPDVIDTTDKLGQSKPVAYCSNSNSADDLDDSIGSDIDEEYIDDMYTSSDGEDNDDREMNGDQSSISIGDDRQQSQQLNDSHLNSSRSSSSAKKRGLSDVINKLHQQQHHNHNHDDQVDQQSHSNHPVPTPSNLYHITNLLMTHNNNKEQQPPNKKFKLSNEPQHDAIQYQHLFANNKIPANKSEIDLFHVLEKANLSSYMKIFTEKGGDDINQLCDADEEEFKEIMDLVGMSSKPLHVKRLKKALDEYKAQKTENANNSSFDYLVNTNLNVSTNKCNLTSPAPNTNSSTNSIYETNSLLCNGLYSSSSAYSSYKVESNTSLSDSPPSLNNTGNNSVGKQHLADGLNGSKKRKNSVDQMSNKVNGDPKANDADGDDDDNGSDDSDDVVGNGVESQTSSEDDMDDNDDGYANDQSEILNSTAESNIKIDTSFLKFTASNTDQNEKNIKKAKVVELYTQGERCVRKLSQITGVPLTTVYRVIGKLKGINYNIPRGNGAGRKTILDTKDREILVNILNIHPRISRKALGKELEKCTGKSIHSSTLNRELCRLRHHGHKLSTTNPAIDDSQLELRNDLKKPVDFAQQPRTLSPSNNKNTRSSNKPNKAMQPPDSSASATNPSKRPTTTTTPLTSNADESEIHENDFKRHLQAATTSNLQFTNYQAMFSPSANMLAAAAAAALAYQPQGQSNKLGNFAVPPFMTYMQQPFNNAAALAAYSSYLNTKTDYPPPFNTYNPSNLNLNSLNNANMA